MIHRTNPARIIIGLRPYLSPTDPQKGEESAPARNALLNNNPDHISIFLVTPIWIRNNGRKGITIEKLDDTINDPIHKTHKFFFQPSIDVISCYNQYTAVRLVYLLNYVISVLIVRIILMCKGCGEAAACFSL